MMTVLGNRTKNGEFNRFIKPTLGFKSMETTYATLKGFEMMRALKKSQA